MAEDEANSIDETLPPVAPAGTDEADSSAADSKLIIGGRYVVEREVGRGGVGEVYLARHQFTGQPVAIKTLRSKWADNDSAIARFEREAKALSQLQHPMSACSILAVKVLKAIGTWRWNGLRARTSSSSFAVLGPWKPVIGSTISSKP